MDVDRITTELKTIPHLRIDMDVDVGPILAEVALINNDFRPFWGYDQDNKNVVENALHLDVRGVVDITEDSFIAGQHSPIVIRDAIARGESVPNHIECKPTELGRQMPTTLKTIYSITDTPARCRISRLKPHDMVPWHIHPRGGGMAEFFYSDFVFHVPLQTNDLVRFGVRNRENPTKEYYQSYKVGEVWLLNTWHDHCVINDSDEDRIHLWICAYVKNKHGDLINPTMLKHAEKALVKYRGERIR